MRLLPRVEYGQIWGDTPEMLSLFSVDASPGDASVFINISWLQGAGSTSQMVTSQDALPDSWHD